MTNDEIATTLDKIKLPPEFPVRMTEFAAEMDAEKAARDFFPVTLLVFNDLFQVSRKVLKQQYPCTHLPKRAKGS